MMRVLIIDGLNFVRRIYSAVPTHTRAGNPTPTEHGEGVIHAVNAAAARAIKHHQPSHAVIVFEDTAPTWRHQLFANYKAERKPQPTELLALLPKIIANLAERHIASVQASGFEADDTISSISQQLASRDISSVILSSDHLLCQLIQAQIVIFDHFQNKALDTDFIIKRYGVKPQQLPDLFALAGQSSVSIPGVSGIGTKTSAQLLQQHNNIEGVLAHQADLPERLSEKISASAHLLPQYKTLFSLRHNVKIDANLNQWRLKN